MDIHPHMLNLLHPYRVGAEVLPGVVFEDASTELGLRLRFSIAGERIWVDVAPLETMRRHAAHSERLGFGYRTEGGRADIDQKLGLRLCEVLAEAVRTNEAGVAAAMEAEARAEADPDARIRHVEVSRALDPSGLHGSNYYTINPYIGCVIGCRFCYAQSPIASMRRLMGLADHAWGAYVEVRRNLDRVLAAELERLEPLPIKFCPIVGDAYQATEKSELVTRRCLERIAAASETGRSWPAMILTRSVLMLRDVDLLARIPEAWAGVSMPTVDDEVRRHFEPRAASVNERLNLLSTLRSAGVATFAVVQPIMSGSIEALADALAAHVDAVVIDVLQEEEGADEDFNDPRYAETRTEDWQRDNALALLDLLRRRGVDVWAQELPPKYCAPGTDLLR